MYLFFEDHLVSTSSGFYDITSVHYGTEAQNITILLTIYLQHIKNYKVQRLYKYIMYKIGCLLEKPFMLALFPQDIQVNAFQKHERQRIKH